MKMLKKNFLLPHRNTNLAFIDGVLCGLLVAKMVYDIRQNHPEMKRWDKFGTDEDETLVFVTPSDK